MITAEVLGFLHGHTGRIALFEAAEAAILACGESSMAVQKSQISWGNPKKFAFLSLPRGAAPKWPEGSLVLTFGLGHQVRHERITLSVEPYPGRWTHHVALARREDVDGTVQGWLRSAYEFAQAKMKDRGAKHT